MQILQNIRIYVRSVEKYITMKKFGSIPSLNRIVILADADDYITAISERYYNIRSVGWESTHCQWYKFNNPADVRKSIMYLLIKCLDQMEKNLAETPIDVRCADWACMSSAGIQVSLRWVRFSETDRTAYDIKYPKHAGRLNDYSTLNFTFEIVPA